MADVLVPVAQYLRMSTEHQRYSIVNQADQIAVYAAQHGMSIVKSYADEGKSGLDALGRGAFLRLIADVANGQATFRAILVLDVSRWGRFQNTDESAHYEYLCTRSGVPVVYCSELFANDGTPFAALLKNIKRSMDGEYSRQLSIKVFVGQCRLARMGYFQGGPPGYGLRRRLIGADGEEKGNLLYGQRKNIQEDRIVLAAGPRREIAIVRSIFKAYADGALSEVQIAKDLNRRRVPAESGGPWERQAVHRVLTNERYLGESIYNRTSTKLRTASVRNPPELWIRTALRFPALVDPSLFERAQALRAFRSHCDDEEMLRLLGALAQRAGRVVGDLIDAEPAMPCAATYRVRFGTLAHAYELAGLPVTRSYAYIEVQRRLRKAAERVTADLAALLCDAGLNASALSSKRQVMLKDRRLTSVMVLNCTEDATGDKVWQIPLRGSRAVETLTVVRMDERNCEPMDFYLLPSEWFTLLPLRLNKNGGRSIVAFRCASFEALAARLAAHAVGVEQKQGILVARANA